MAGLFASEGPWVWGGVASYLLGAVAAWTPEHGRRTVERIVMAGLATGVTLLALAIAVRWLRVGYGPFLTMFEILLSNLFSLGLVYLLVYWRLAAVRSGALFALPVLLLMGVWVLSVSAEPSRLPATYDNYWLWIHITVGKIFLGTCLVAVGLAGVVLARRSRWTAFRFPALGPNALLDAWAWKFMMVAFVFHSLMLIAGAVWAQDAWGRYWAWDPLETWAFITWLALGIGLHVRTTYAIKDWIGALMIVGVFALAFLTFFGVPFLSVAPHKGVM